VQSTRCTAPVVVGVTKVLLEDPVVQPAAMAEDPVKYANANRRVILMIDFIVFPCRSNATQCCTVGGWS